VSTILTGLADVELHTIHQLYEFIFHLKRNALMKVLSIASLMALATVVATAQAPATNLTTTSGQVQSQNERENDRNDFVAPQVFQAAGSSAASIQSTVDAYRAALGATNNGNTATALTSGRREINWDGGSPTVNTTTAPVTPFDTFLNTRGARFTTPGLGLSQAPVSGGPQNGLVGLFNNSNYANIFKAFSQQRLFTPVGSNVTDGIFFVPGTNGTVPAVVSGFGAIFTDVDRPLNSKHGERPSTVIRYYGADGRLLFTSAVPAAPGDGNFSFFGIVFNDARIARVSIQAGNVAPGPDDDARHDIVMMDDFFYGEPQAIQ
jgi:hypothetical protein